MKMLAVVALVLLGLVLPQHTGEALPSGRLQPMAKRYNYFDAGPCIAVCSAECGGICFFNTRTFSHDCNCAFKRSMG